MDNKNLIPSPHINAKKEQVAKVVLMPGDPLRAKYIANKFLQEVEEINNVRNMLMYTGTYKGKKVTVAGSGMGMPSIGIYSYEFFKFYDVDCIIRIGSSGSYHKDIHIYDVINVSAAYSESTYAKYASDFYQDTIKSTETVKNLINKVAEENNILIKTGLIHSTDIFYRANGDEWKTNSKIQQCLAVEMEAFALFSNAIYLKKDAACLLTISDSFVSKQALSADARQSSFEKMMFLALEAAKLYQEERKL
ncbi:MAG: purine-nucleoside phosphorylase [Spiroplasma sp.]